MARPSTKWSRKASATIASIDPRLRRRALGGARRSCDQIGAPNGTKYGPGRSLFSRYRTRNSATLSQAELQPMLQDRLSRGKPLRWMHGVLERSGDLVALGGGMIGIALILAVVLVGLHERQTPFRAMSPSEQGQSPR